MLKSKNFLPVIVLFLFSVITLAGCSSSRELSEDRDTNKKGVTDYKKSEEFVSTNALKEKTSIDKENLESISSSLGRFIDESSLLASVEKDEVMYKVIEYLNTPYRWGGTTKRGIDCSAFVQTVMYQSLGVILPRTSFEQSNVGVEVAVEDLKFGDLLFFDTMNKGRTSHVGIYLEDGYFVHSGSRTGVAVASLNSDFYSRTFLKAKRVTDDEDLRIDDEE